jgi:hypothetical protein
VNTSSPDLRRRAAFLAALGLVALACLWRLDRPLLWGDEGHTAAMARGILRTGVPTAFDGRNLVLFDIRAGLNRHLVSREVPWVQWYVGAASMAVFGRTTAGVRILFALAAVAAFLPLRAALRGKVRMPELTAALALLAPQAVLFDRNARYYPILVLLFACLVWHMGASFRSGRVRFAVSTALFVLLFHTHTLVALGIASALVLHCALWMRERLAGYLASAAIGFCSWAAWIRAMGPPLTDSPLFQTWAPVNGLGDWCAVFLQGILSMVVDMDAVGALPLLVLAAAAAYLWARNRPALAGLAREPLVGFVLLAVLVQAVGTAAVSGTETAAKLAILRYMPHLAVLGVAACLVILDRVIVPRAAFAAGALLLVATNLGTLSFWASPLGRSVPWSWAVPAYSDILAPGPDALDGVIAALRASPPPSWAGDRAVIPVPAWTQATLIFYLGDLYIIPPDYSHQPGPHDDQGEPYIREELGFEAYSRLSAQPLWLVDSLDAFRTPPDGLVPVAAFPSARARPDDGGRPELTRHAFSRGGQAARVVVYRWTGD